MFKLHGVYITQKICFKKVGHKFLRTALDSVHANPIVPAIGVAPYVDSMSSAIAYR